MSSYGSSQSEAARTREKFDGIRPRNFLILFASFRDFKLDTAFFGPFHGTRYRTRGAA